MDLTYIMQERNYFILPSEKKYKSSILFHRKISGSHHFGCEDSPQSIFLRGQKFYQFSMNRSRYGGSIHRLSVKVNLVDPVSSKKLPNNFREQLTLTFRPSSHSFAFLILKQQKCAATTRME